jgi:hypothetical protein
VLRRRGVEIGVVVGRGEIVQLDRVGAGALMARRVRGRRSRITQPRIVALACGVGQHSIGDLRARELRSGAQPRIAARLIFLRLFLVLRVIVVGEAREGAVVGHAAAAGG